ncbi:MAG: PQQ-binding-like beta-propeller repeat protein [Candidatus Stahlbacteria bacterium]|nr:PQQ-binding-like beta-propeller repeat protein [Candidatus Stahlbacteria bacterium]
MRGNFVKSALIIGIVSISAFISTNVFADIDYWLMFRHDAQRTGQSPYPGTAVCDSKWTYSVYPNDAYFHSSPAIKGLTSEPDPAHNPMCYIGNMQRRRVFAFKDMMFNAIIRWEYMLSGATEQFNSSPAVGAIGTDGAIYIGNRNCNVYAFRQDGTVKWIFPTVGEVHSSPVLSASGVVFIGSEDSTLYAINSTTGVQVWKYDLPKKVQSSPALSHDEATVYVATSEFAVSGKLYAINAATGGFNWEFNANTSDASPSVGPDNTIYIGSRDGKLYAVNPNGTQKWVYNSGVSSSVASAAISANGSTVYFIYGGTMRALSTADGSQIWKTSLPLGGINSHYGGPILSSNNRLYVGVGWSSGDGKGRLYNLNATSGSIDCYYDTDDEVWDTPAIGPDNTVYFGDCSGHTFYAIWDRQLGIEEQGIGVDKILRITSNPVTYSTTIYYRVDKESDVEIGIYDISGKRVAEIVKDAHQVPGNYTASWNGNKVPNGIYFCKVKIGNKSAVQKLLLMKM